MSNHCLSLNDLFLQFNPFLRKFFDQSKKNCKIHLKPFYDHKSFVDTISVVFEKKVSIYAFNCIEAVFCICFRAGRTKKKFSS